MRAEPAKDDVPSDTGKQRLCAIHQPNFFPWLGYFDKVRRADIFVFLDDVDYPRSSGSMGTWCNRVRIDVQGRAQWVGAPVARYSGRRRIADIEIAEDGRWRKNLKRTLQMNYAKAANYDCARALLDPLIDYDSTNLADFNINAIMTVCAVLGIKATFVRQSELSTRARSTELLVEITEKVGAEGYLAGGGAEAYQEDALFAEKGISLIYQNFEPEPYGTGDIIAGLSVIDFLMKSDELNLASRDI